MTGNADTLSRITRIAQIIGSVVVWFMSVVLVYPEEPSVIEETSANVSITLSALVQEGRIILLWTPANQLPSDGIKVSRALDPGFAPDSVDQYTKWLPGTGYSQCVLYPSAASDKTYYYRVSSVVTGREAVCLAVSNPVEVAPLKENPKPETNDEDAAWQTDWTAP